ncbi:unnamed protein product [Hapterophycus canaliculatus]
MYASRRDDDDDVDDDNRSGISDVGLSHLAAGSPLLRDLDLSGCSRVTESGVETLSTLQDLETLNLSICR